MLTSAVEIQHLFLDRGNIKLLITRLGSNDQYDFGAANQTVPSHWRAVVTHSGVCSTIFHNDGLYNNSSKNIRWIELNLISRLQSNLMYTYIYTQGHSNEKTVNSAWFLSTLIFFISTWTFWHEPSLSTFCAYFLRPKPSCAMCLIFLKLKPSCAYSAHWITLKMCLFFSSKASCAYFFRRRLHVLCA